MNTACRDLNLASRLALKFQVTPVPLVYAHGVYCGECDGVSMDQNAYHQLITELTTINWSQPEAIDQVQSILAYSNNQTTSVEDHAVRLQASCAAIILVGKNGDLLLNHHDWVVLLCNLVQADRSVDIKLAAVLALMAMAKHIKSQKNHSGELIVSTLASVYPDGLGANNGHEVVYVLGVLLLARVFPDFDQQILDFLAQAQGNGTQMSRRSALNYLLDFYSNDTEATIEVLKRSHQDMAWSVEDRIKNGLG